MATVQVGATLLLVALACAWQLWRDPIVFNTYFQLVWPPSSKSLPALLSVAVAFVIFVQRTFFRRGMSEESRRVLDVKRRRIMAQMTEALKWNDDDGDGDAQAAVGDETPISPKAEKKDKLPPPAKDLFEMIFDDIEERHVTEYGIIATSAVYVDVLALFKERLTADFEEAVKYTELARAVDKSGQELDPKEAKLAAQFRDGTKLADLIELYQKKIKKHFGRKVMPAKILRAAEVCHKVTTAEQRKGARMLIPILRPLMPLYMVSIVLMIFDSMLGSVLWNSMSTLLDGIDQGTMTLEGLKWVALSNYAKFIFCIFAHLGSRAFTGKVTSQFRLKVRSEIMRSMLRQDTAFFDIFPSGVLQERLNKDAEELASRLFDLPLDAVHMFCMLLSNAIAIFSIKADLFWMIGIPMPIISVAQYFIIKYMDKLETRQRKIGEHSAAGTMEVIKEVRTVREFAMESEEGDNFAANSGYRAEIEEFGTAIHNIIFISPLVCIFVGTRLVSTYLCGSHVAEKTLTVGQAIQIGYAADHLQHLVRELMFMTPKIIRMLNPLGRVCDMLNAKPKIEPLPGSAPKLKPERFEGLIEFKDVEFTFPSEPHKKILNKLTFTIRPGEKVAFVGSTGCGKSTSIRLIERFYNVNAGIIMLDGRPIDEYDVHHLRQHMSVVAQDNVLFSTTLRENIIYGIPREHRETITDEEVEDACRRANAWHFINEFPRKLETYAGERGVKLSGGQKQRLAIARAIIRKPTIVLLDEATSALDSKAEGVVQKALDKMIEDNKTGCTVMIAHRLATVKTCNNIIVMDKGSIMEQGSHDALLRIPIKKSPDGSMETGWYNDLWTTQMGTGAAATGDQADSARVQYLERRVHELESEVFRLRGLREPVKRHRLGHATRIGRMPEPLPCLRFASDQDGEKQVPLPLGLDRAYTTPNY